MILDIVLDFIAPTSTFCTFYKLLIISLILINAFLFNPSQLLLLASKNLGCYASWRRGYILCHFLSLRFLCKWQVVKKSFTNLIHFTKAYSKSRSSQNKIVDVGIPKYICSPIRVYHPPCSLAIWHVILGYLNESTRDFMWIVLWPFLIGVCVLGCSVVSSCLGPMDCNPPGTSVHGDSPGKSTEVGCHALLQGIFST